MTRLTLDPEWWARARKLKAHGMQNKTIALSVGKSVDAVQDCLCEKTRRKKLALHKKQHLKRKSETGKVYDYKRQEARKFGREKFRAEGGDLRKIYRELGCL